MSTATTAAPAQETIKLEPSPVLTTAAQVRQVLKETAIPADHWNELGISPDIHFHDLLPEQIKILSDAVIENRRCVYVEVSAETIVPLLGLREIPADSPEVPWRKIGKKAYAADNNVVNRFLTVSRADFLSELISGGMFATSTSGTYSSAGQLINAGHRLAGAVSAIERDPTVKIVMPFEFGIPPQLRDLWDFKNKEKKLHDILYQNPSFMADDILNYGYDGDSISELDDGQPTPAQRVAYRNKLSHEYPSFVGFTLMRLSGKHIHNHTDDRAILQFGEQRCPDAERLCYEVFRRSLQSDGKQAAQFKRLPVSQWCTALLLASNADNDDGSEIVVDWELVDRVLAALLASTESAGPFALMLSSVGQAFSHKKKLSRKGVFDVIVNSIKQFEELGKVERNPVPTETQLKSKVYPTFGGLDIGHQDKPKDE